MQTMLRRNSAIYLLIVLVLAAPLAWASELKTVSYHFLAGKNTLVNISTTKDVVEVKKEEADKSKVLRIDDKLKKTIRDAADIKQISSEFINPKTGAAIVATARYPSQRTNPMGYCGAGFEDYLLLLVVDNDSLLLKDRLLLQSCLSALSLDSDGEDDPSKLIVVRKADSVELGITWLNHPKYGDKEQIFVVSNNRFSVK